jgi:hypothetical protein
MTPCTSHEILPRISARGYISTRRFIDTHIIGPNFNIRFNYARKEINPRSAYF